MRWGELIPLGIVDHDLGGPTSRDAIRTADAGASLRDQHAVGVSKISGLARKIAVMSVSPANWAARDVDRLVVIRIITRPLHSGVIRPCDLSLQ